MDRCELPSRLPNERFVAAIPSGAEVWEESKVPGRPPKRHIAGGATAIEAHAAEAAQKVAQEMAELRKTGTKFNGKPQPTRWNTVFLLAGAVLISGGLIWHRWRER